jgi:hypothetical protein
LFINLTPLDFYKVTLPLYPPPFDKGGGINYIREASPLFNSLSVLVTLKERGKRL